MAAYIECRNCDSPYCDGCNIYSLATMLNNGKFDCLMNNNHSINCSADVVEVVHSKWILYTDGSGECERCHTRQKNVWDFENWQNFCGHCGAKMDGKGN
jgi:hypothetical protein